MGCTGGDDKNQQHKEIVCEEGRKEVGDGENNMAGRRGARAVGERQQNVVQENEDGNKPLPFEAEIRIETKRSQAHGFTNSPPHSKPPAPLAIRHLVAKGQPKNMMSHGGGASW